VPIFHQVYNMSKH